jgi:hypothetical protein
MHSSMLSHFSHHRRRGKKSSFEAEFLLLPFLFEFDLQHMHTEAEFTGGKSTLHHARTKASGCFMALFSLINNNGLATTEYLMGN